ncbi:CBS domain-containing protein [Cumulibacter manganitolerans]|uniref:CBS domain-containing protein n=1 Tax=Cumulibacter manganitolerans TaxID=1884992 RepID=UPI001294B5D3|nr:CBS domain-containing protein [Cumulibacter manganitolerans]
MKISDILHHKGGDIVTVTPETTVRELVTVLAEHNIGAVVVSADGERLDGIVSERDIVRNLVTLEPLSGRPVSDIMTADVHTCRPEAEVDSLRTQMTERRIRHVPVTDGERLVGIVSIGDVVKSSIGQLQFERDQLSNYLNQ